MEHLLNQLLKILQTEQKTLDVLCALAEKKVNALVKGNVKLLEEIMEKEQEMKISLSRLDEERNQSVEEIHRYMPQLTAPITIKMIIEALPFEKSMALSAVRVVIQTQLKKLGETNALCTELIQNHLTYVDYMMNMFTGQRVQTANYGMNGYAQAGGKGHSIFDNKV